MVTNPKLTFTELLGLRAEHNLADGHARQNLNERQLMVIGQLPNIFWRAFTLPQDVAENRFRETFFSTYGENITGLPPPVLFYSASVATHAVGRFLSDGGYSVGLVTPTFDNLYALLVAQGVSVYPIEEAAVVSAARNQTMPAVTALFLVLPNNPTGFRLADDDLFSLACAAAAADVLLVLDLSFRYFDDYSKNTYSILQRSGCRFIGIEDTGKSIPSLDVKVGMTVADSRTHPLLAEIAEDILLNVSPFQLELLTELISADDRLLNLHIVQQNREVLHAASQHLGLEPKGLHPKLSVEWLRSLTTPEYALRLQSVLQRSGVVVLPGGPFFWDDPRRGMAYLRVALARPTDTFASSVTRAVAIVRTQGAFS